MRSRNVSDAANSLFVRCIASTDSVRAFGRAASLVKRLARAEGRAHFAHLASALEEQQLYLQMLYKTNLKQAARHASTRDRELNAFQAAVRTRASDI